ncbi:MAG: ABC transporter ATP-binding protein [Sphaerochaetaceae bacterium]
MEETFVEFKNITKTFPGIIANDNISLKIKKGEIFALLGENGAGKSTLMSILFGLYEPDEGEIYINGKEVSITSPLKANKLNIGMVHQHFKLISNQTVAENIILGQEPIKMKWGFLPQVDIEKANKEVEELSKRYNLEVNPTAIIKDLTVSVRQRVEILKMLYRNAELLIFDEPTSILAPQEITSLLEIIKGLRAKGKTIILISHKLDEIKKVADRCAILTKGKLIGEVLDVKTTSIKEMAGLMVGGEVSFVNKKEVIKQGKVVLEVDNLTVENKNHLKVVNNVSFKLHEGEILSIAGVAGNGQTEVADAILNLIPITMGIIKFKGEDISKLSIRERIEKGISYIPEDRQNVGLLMDFPLSDNLVLKNYYKEPYCNKKGILNYSEFKKNGEKLIKNYDIRTSRGNDTIVRSMSGGNQQKAIVAREISMEADLVIFVQPTRGLDIGAEKSIHDRIFDLRKKGKAILLISLELDEVMELADTILVLYNGKIQQNKSADQFTKNEVGEYMMGVHNND